MHYAVFFVTLYYYNYMKKDTLLIPCDICKKEVVRLIKTRAVCFDCKLERIRSTRKPKAPRKEKPKPIRDEQFCIVCERPLRYLPQRVIFCCKVCKPLVYKSMR
jgi:hypothetical protein